METIYTLYMKNLLFSVLLLAITPTLLANEDKLQISGRSEKIIKVSDSTINPNPLLTIIEEQLTALRAGNISKAYTEYTSSEFKKITTIDQFKRFVGNFSVLSQNKSFQFNSVNFEKSIATFEGTLISKEGDSLQAEYDLVQEQGKWKILGIQLFKPEETTLRPEVQ